MSNETAGVPIAPELMAEVHRTSACLMALIPSCRPHRVPRKPITLYSNVQFTWPERSCGPLAGFTIGLPWIQVWPPNSAGQPEPRRVVTMMATDDGFLVLLSDSAGLPSTFMFSNAQPMTKGDRVEFGSRGAYPLESMVPRRKHVAMFAHALKDGLNLKIRQAVIDAETAEGRAVQEWEAACEAAKKEDTEMREFFCSIG